MEGAEDRRRRAEAAQRWTVLSDLEAWLRAPMLALSFLWLALVTAELALDASAALEGFAMAIWVVFILEFLLRLALAPARLAFLRRNWLTVIALLAPALRLFAAFRLLRFARLARGLRLVRVVGTANRSMNALRASLRRRGLGYVLGATAMVILLGAAGMLAFEPAAQVAGGFEGYGDALWWTGMLVASMGTDFWPQTVEGRILCMLLALYGFAVFGYITASFASYFVGRDAADDEAETVGAGDIAALRSEIAALRRTLRERR